ncbi:MAG: NAD-dependent epimerase/dehydratase family protein [Gemmatimonadetes bacterium]|nr:NAD-dependent epimerase/dehydratase family protein [Gemmatimonadota bacterium]
MNVLVTGGAGFIGSHVADAFLARGDRVWVLDDLSRGKRANVPAGAELIVADLADASVRDLFRDTRFDLVSHHAAQVDVRASVANPAEDARVNLVGLLNLTEAALETGTSRIVFVSSGGVVYGEPEQRPTPESAHKLPLSPYGVSKLAAEHYLHYYRRVRGLEYVALRYANVYGPRQDPHGEAGVVAIFSNRLLENVPLTIFGDGEQTRDYVFVGDIVTANLLASEMSLPAAPSDLDAVAYNVGTGLGTSVNALADVLERVAGSVHGRERRPARPGELLHSALDAARLREKGWAPRFSLEQGLQQTFAYIAADREREGRLGPDRMRAR